MLSPRYVNGLWLRWISPQRRSADLLPAGRQVRVGPARNQVKPPVFIFNTFQPRASSYSATALSAIFLISGSLTIFFPVGVSRSGCGSTQALPMGWILLTVHCCSFSRSALRYSSRLFSSSSPSSNDQWQSLHNAIPFVGLSSKLSLHGLTWAASTLVWPSF